MNTTKTNIGNGRNDRAAQTLHAQAQTYKQISFGNGRNDSTDKIPIVLRAVEKIGLETSFSTELAGNPYLYVMRITTTTVSESAHIAVLDHFPAEGEDPPETALITDNIMQWEPASINGKGAKVWRFMLLSYKAMGARI